VRSVLDHQWIARCDAQIEELEADQLPDGPLQLLREYCDTPELVSLLESSIEILEPRARELNRLRDLRETISKLGGCEFNQSGAAIFELRFLEGLVSASAEHRLDVELFPRVSESGSNVEAKIRSSDRWVYLEAKALGYTARDWFGETGTFHHSESSEERQLLNALREKVKMGKQLALVPTGEPGVLSLALGYCATPLNAPRLIQGILRDGMEGLAAVLLFEGRLCRVPPLLICNPAAINGLSPQEADAIKGLRFSSVSSR